MTPSNRSSMPSVKRRKLDVKPTIADVIADTNTTSGSLHRPISPPVPRRKTPVPASTSLLAPAPSWNFDDVPKQTSTISPLQPPPQPNATNQTAANTSKAVKREEYARVHESEVKYVASPFQLTKIRDLAPNQNLNAIELKDILGDPMIKECWNFNFLFDLDFVMQQFDEDVRNLVKVKIIHGFWKRDDERRIGLMETAERYHNIELISAYLPDPFGTHHSKMLILFRYDDCAQIVIHTANMITKDWTNMTQAVWQSPLLPLSSTTFASSDPHPIGTGERFKVDLLRYLGNYEKRLRRLSEQLNHYDFSAIRAAFLGSSPSRQVVSETDSSKQTPFGWLGLREVLNSVPARARKHATTPSHIVLQVSSIATLGAAPTWLAHFQSILARSRTSQQLPIEAQPNFNIIFPTPEEVRTSLDGYESGGSIHTKLQSIQQQKQLQYLHPLFCHWKHHPLSPPASSAEPRNQAHRGPAAPHIKTYIRFSDDTHKSIDWALLTSANLSKQAWGDVVNKQGEVRVQSYETGVLVWPDLFAKPRSEVAMVPTFGKDTPGSEDVPVNAPVQDLVGETANQEDDEETEDENQDDAETEDEDETEDKAAAAQQQRETNHAVDKGKAPAPNSDTKRTIVGLRMPYDLPLTAYSATDVPWCATQPYTEPDWKGRAWGGY